MKRLLVIVLLSVVAGLAVRTWVIGGVAIASASMEPTLPVGNSYLTNHLVLLFREPRRGEIVDFTSPIDGETGMVKRVVAIAGDTIELRDKKVYLNGSLVEEPYTKYTRPNELLEGDFMKPLKVPPGNIFVLGDNRDESDDSSVWKDLKTGEHKPFVPLSNVKGTLILP